MVYARMAARYWSHWREAISATGGVLCAGSCFMPTTILCLSLNKTMTEERYQQLSYDEGHELTKEERAEGWHWCCEYDNLLVGPGMGELRSCYCLRKNHPAYKTIPEENLAVEFIEED